MACRPVVPLGKKIVLLGSQNGDDGPNASGLKLCYFTVLECGDWSRRQFLYHPNLVG
jgi:hypothetical protein